MFLCERTTMKDKARVSEKKNIFMIVITNKLTEACFALRGHTLPVVLHHLAQRRSCCVVGVWGRRVLKHKSTFLYSLGRRQCCKSFFSCPSFLNSGCVVEAVAIRVDLCQLLLHCLVLVLLLLSLLCCGFVFLFVCGVIL